MLTSSLDKKRWKLFSGTQALPENRGHVLTIVFGLQVDILKMISNDKMLNIKVVRLVETSNFAFWVIAIRASLQNQELKYCKNTPGQYRGRPTLDGVCP